MIEVKKDFIEINGEKVFIYGGDLSYCRIPRRSWKERILQMKAAGMNTVAFYAVWAYHQPEPDVFPRFHPITPSIMLSASVT